ncbi:MAG: ATP-grasp domain-containing protein [Methylophilales bacterium]|nr:ATP-grasp domain-containing protein [Methylophilales bacterium]
MAAAQAGYQVAAMDAFHDAETRRFCMWSALLRYANGGFDAGDVWQKLSSLEGVTGVMYGSGFENQPELLEKIAAHYPLLGNDAGIIAKTKHPLEFFTLLDQLNISHPPVQYTPPADGDWLIKSAGGSGGTHIRESGQAQDDDYFQRKVEGIPVSVLFLADGSQARIVGFNEQWCAPTHAVPYRYGGAVSQANLPERTKTQMADAAQQLTAHFALRGLNSLDCILARDEVLVLEINPRLTATFDLYDQLFEHHLQACKGMLMPLCAATKAKAHVIVYAPHHIYIPESFIWPDWVVDTPLDAVFKNQPLCTVLASAADAFSAKNLVFARASQLEAQLASFYSLDDPS